MDIMGNILLGLLAVLLYGGGLLLWPIRRWLRRKQANRGRALFFVFITQFAAYALVACLACFIKVQHGYYWLIFAIELNVVFTLAGAVAWARDGSYERAKKAPPTQ
jgi:hypothetical protein